MFSIMEMWFDKFGLNVKKYEEGQTITTSMEILGAVSDITNYFQCSVTEATISHVVDPEARQPSSQNISGYWKGAEIDR